MQLQWSLLKASMAPAYQEMHPLIFFPWKKALGRGWCCSSLSMRGHGWRTPPHLDPGMCWGVTVLPFWATTQRDYAPNLSTSVSWLIKCQWIHKFIITKANFAIAWRGNNIYLVPPYEHLTDPHLVANVRLWHCVHFSQPLLKPTLPFVLIKSQTQVVCAVWMDFLQGISTQPTAIGTLLAERSRELSISKKCWNEPKAHPYWAT